jgi:CRP-like cAMP-binding protein
MEKYIDKIKNNILFKNIANDEIDKIILCSGAKILNYEDGCTVFERDDSMHQLGIVLEGEFNLVLQKYSGARTIITTLCPNDLFGEALIFSSSKKAPYDLVSFGKSSAIMIPYSFFFSTCSDACGFHSMLISNMLTILSDKIMMLNSKMQILNADTIRGKISVYLISLYKKTKSMTFDMPMNRQELADFLNVTRPSLSRELSNMQEDKIIDVYRSSVKIINLPALYEFAE